MHRSAYRRHPAKVCYIIMFILCIVLWCVCEMLKETWIGGLAILGVPNSGERHRENDRHDNLGTFFQNISPGQ